MENFRVMVNGEAIIGYLWRRMLSYFTRLAVGCCTLASIMGRRGGGRLI
jgi:hypothetical protein